MTATFRSTNVVVTLGGTVIDSVTQIKASLGTDLRVATATVTLAGLKPSFGTYGDAVSITVNGILRWSGFFKQWATTLFPRSPALTAYGPLAQAAQYFPVSTDDNVRGIRLADFMGSTVATDQAIVQTVLTTAGISYTPSDIGGTGTVLGTVAPDQFIWSQTTSAIDFIRAIDQISVSGTGIYKTYEQANKIVRTLIPATPTASADMTLTEGTDILDGSLKKGILDTYNAVRVTGFDDGTFNPKIFYTVSSNAWQSSVNPRVYAVTNSMIERSLDADAGDGMSAETVANYWLAVLNRERYQVTLTTPRDDSIDPGDIHLIQGASGASDRLDVAQKFVTGKVDFQLNQKGAVYHALQYVGGA